MGPGPLPQIACFACVTPLRYIGNFRPQSLGHPLDQILDPHLGCVTQKQSVGHFWRSHINWADDSGRSRKFETEAPGVWAENLLFEKIFAENCTKMKEVGPRGASLASPLNLPKDEIPCCMVIYLRQRYFRKAGQGKLSVHSNFLCSSFQTNKCVTLPVISRASHACKEVIMTNGRATCTTTANTYHKNKTTHQTFQCGQIISQWQKPHSHAHFC